MSGEDPWDPGLWTANFRVKCSDCGEQIQFASGRRVEPDCGHEVEFLRLNEEDL